MLDKAAMEMSLTQLRADAAAIFRAAVQAVDPDRAVKRHVFVSDSAMVVAGKSYLFNDLRKIFVVGAGKAVVPMAQAMEALLGERISAGMVIAKHGQARPLARVQVIEAAHPIPDLAGVEGARQIAQLAQLATTEDLVICLLSGGASALLVCPADGLTLADKQAVTQMLLNSGATIGETNTVRRHLSQIKGGRLAALAQPAQMVTLILSDVVGDSLEDIGSGPTAPDPSRYGDCLEIVRKYGLQQQLPAAAWALLERGDRGELSETAKPGAAIFSTVQNLIIGSNRLATQEAQLRAEKLGYRAWTLSNTIAGESRAVAKQHGALLKSLRRDADHGPVCIVSGGETTVTVRGTGVGGRNQEFALAAAMEIAGVDGAVVLSAGTDGIDGPTDAAGAIVDGATLRRGHALGYVADEFLARNDAYPYLRGTGDLLITGPTDTNVMDLQVMLIA